MEKERIVLFIDILGFSDYVMNHSMQESYKILADFNEKFSSLNNMLVSGAISSLKKIDPSIEEKRVRDEHPHHILSDSIIITANCDNEKTLINSLLILFMRLNGIQFEMFRKNLPIRGGISIGSFYNKKGYIFGKGLVKAAKLEKSAMTPRILVDPAIFMKLNTAIVEGLGIYITKDSDGFYYCDYFKHAARLPGLKIDKDQDGFARKTFNNLFVHWKECIAGYLQLNAGNPMIKAKVDWVQMKFNESLKDVNVVG